MRKVSGGKRIGLGKLMKGLSMGGATAAGVGCGTGQKTGEWSQVSTSLKTYSLICWTCKMRRLTSQDEEDSDDDEDDDLIVIV